MIDDGESAENGDNENNREMITSRYRLAAVVAVSPMFAGSEKSC